MRVSRKIVKANVGKFREMLLGNWVCLDVFDESPGCDVAVLLSDAPGFLNELDIISACLGLYRFLNRDVIHDILRI